MEKQDVWKVQKDNVCTYSDSICCFLWMICCENDRKVSDKAIGETTVQSMRSGEKSVSLEQSDIPKIEIEDLTDAFTVILQYASKDMLAGCTVDESFLMWFYAQYGRDAVIHIAFDVLDGGNDPDVWYEETGNSIHVLWLLYCRDSGFGQHELENVYWMQTAAASEWYLDSPVILISQRTGIQPSI